MEKRYTLNVIDSDELFAKIKRFRALDRTTSVVGLLLLGSTDSSLPLPKRISSAFVKALHKSVIEFRKIVVEQNDVVQMANDLSTLEVVSYTTMRLLMHLGQFNPPRPVLDVLINVALPEAIFTDVKISEKVLGPMITLYMDDEKPVSLLKTRLYISNKEGRMILDHSELERQYIWSDYEAAKFNSEYTWYSLDFARFTYAFDAVVDKLAEEFSAYVCDTMMRR